MTACCTCITITDSESLNLCVCMCVCVCVLIGGGKGACRFCGTTSNTGLLGIGNVCSDQECQERMRKVCDKTLSCGHFCCGVKGEETCLPCLHGCGSSGDKAESDGKPRLKQDADDMCMICYTEGLSCAPCVQVSWRKSFLPDHL